MSALAIVDMVGVDLSGPDIATRIKDAAVKLAADGVARATRITLSVAEWERMVAERRAECGPADPQDEASGDALLRLMDPAGGPSPMCDLFVLIERAKP